MSLRREFGGKSYYPIEDSYYDDGREISRLYICETDKAIERHLQLMMPVYLASWPRDVDPGKEECRTLVEDPYREYNITYHGEYPNAEKTYQFLGTQWRLREADGSYRYVDGKTYNSGSAGWKEKGYVPSEAEWQLLSEYEDKKKKAEEFFQEFTGGDPADGDSGIDLKKLVGITYKLFSTLDPKGWQRSDILFRHFNAESTYGEVASVLTDLRRVSKTPLEFQKAFSDKGVEPVELWAFLKDVGRHIAS